MTRRAISTGPWLAGHSGAILALGAGSSAPTTPPAAAPRPELLVSLSTDGTAILWNWRTVGGWQMLLATSSNAFLSLVS